MNAVSEQKKQKLVELLEELFQMDQPDLDFGLYRIMHAKSDDIKNYLKKDLLVQIGEIFKDAGATETANLKQELEKARHQAKDLGVDPNESPKVKELQKQIDGKSADTDKTAGEIFDALYGFFRRYYSEGDFLSKRVYKEGVYAIPYEGEEVKLYWANSDQYYIKTSEYLRDYTFCLNPNPKPDESPRRVHFRLRDAEEGEHGNIKSEDEKKRVFILAPGEFAQEEKGELTIWFEYRMAKATDGGDGAKVPTQKALIEIALERINNPKENLYEAWFRDLMKKGAKGENSPLEKQLNRYTGRNTFDFFIHKNLGGFLRRELDFYIKNEIMHLDDIENQNAPRVETYLTQLKVVRKIAGKIIDFLAQIEDYQKKLWLKKKFVVEANYCLTLDRIPESFYGEIATNNEQREEWGRLYSIDEIVSDSDSLLESAPAYSEPLSVEFLKTNPFLVLDTRFFSSEFKERLIAEIDDFDAHCDGLLIHSENFQALNLLQRRYHEQVKCVYIDPPYNSPSSEIIYKNNYRDSSWISLMEGRLSLNKFFLTNNGSTVIAIDKYEHNNLFALCSTVFSSCDIVSVTVEHNKKGTQGNHFSFSNEYAIFIMSPMATLNEKQRPAAEWEYSNFRNWGGESERKDAANCFYPIYIKDEKIIGYGLVMPEEEHPEGANVNIPEGALKVFTLEDTFGKIAYSTKEAPIIAIYPIDDSGVERKWRFAIQSLDRIFKYLKTEISRRGNTQIIMPKFTDQFKTVWTSSEYNAGDYGTKILTSMGFSSGLFDYPKSIYTVTDCIYAVIKEEDTILDYFAGSGTTGHAVINLNREDNGQRKYILVEMGNHFDTVLKPRMEKVVYAKDWRGGKPIDRNSGVSHCFKYIRLESYEDTLNNLIVPKESDTEKKSAGSGKRSEFDEEYLLHYFLDTETKGSASLLDIKQFLSPEEYKLRVKLPGSDESRERTVDLVETFNYLLGLVIEHTSITYHYNAQFGQNESGRIGVKPKSFKPEKSGRWWFKTVEGRLLDGKRVLIVWRNRPGGESPEGMAQDNAVLDHWFEKEGRSSCDSEFDLIFVNGTNNLANLNASDQQCKVRLIEDEFNNRMWEYVD